MTDKNIIIIESGKKLKHYWREIWIYRELFYFFVWRDFKVRYKQTLLGTAWAIFKPIIATIIFTLLFHRLAGFESGQIPYPLFVLSGVLIWNFFSEGLSASSQSLIQNAGLVSKIYFPRIIIPSSSVLRGIVDLFVSLIIFIFLSVYYNFYPHMTLILFPVVLVYAIFTSIGPALLFSSLSVKYRDIAQILPFFIQLMMWISPVGYSSSKIPQNYEFIYWLNPMAGVIELSRFCLLGSNSADMNYILISVSSAILIFILGFISFNQLEKEFADVI